MAGYPRAEGDVLISAATLQAIGVAIFQKCGMSARDAALLTETLVVADLRGCHSHGVLRIPEYVSKLVREGVESHRRAPCGQGFRRRAGGGWRK